VKRSKKEDIEDLNPGVHIGNEDLMLEEFAEEEPQTAKHAPDPNVIEILGDNDESMPEEMLGEEAVEERDEPMIDTPAKATRRSTRSIAGTTTNYEDYVRTDGVSGLTTKWGLALANLRVKVALETFGDKAHDAIADELTSLFIKKKALKAIKRNDWVKLSAEVKAAGIIMSHMFLREKYDGAGIFEKIKARLVGDGRMQNAEEFENISSPIAKLESIFNTLKLVVEEDRHMIVGSAYLNAKIDKPVYMWLSWEVVKVLIEALPEFKEFVDDKGRILVEIEKALYGLVQSAKLWFDTLAGVLNRNGFKCNLMDPCVFNKTVNGDQITVVVYVDDLLITCRCKSEINKVKSLIEKEFIEIKVKEGSEFTYLGMEIKRYDNGSISVAVRAYIESILKEWSEQCQQMRTYLMWMKQVSHQRRRSYFIVWLRSCFTCVRGDVQMLH